MQFLSWFADVEAAMRQDEEAEFRFVLCPCAFTSRNILFTVFKVLLSLRSLGYCVYFIQPLFFQ